MQAAHFVQHVGHAGTGRIHDQHVRGFPAFDEAAQAGLGRSVEALDMVESEARQILLRVGNRVGVAFDSDQPARPGRDGQRQIPRAGIALDHSLRTCEVGQP